MYLYSRAGFGLQRSCTEVRRPTFWWFCVNPGIPPQVPQKVTFFFFFFFFSFISLIADGPHHYHPACGHKGSSHLSPVHALQFFYRDASSALLQLVNQWLNFYLLTFPRFPLRKKEHKSYFGKNRTHDFRTSRCAAYLLDYSGDEQHTHIQLTFFGLVACRRLSASEDASAGVGEVC